MRLADIDEEEFRAILVGVVDFFQIARLATERRSGVAAEDEHHGLFAFEAGQFHFFGFLQIREQEIRGDIACTQFRGFAFPLGRRRVDFGRFAVFLRLTRADVGKDMAEH